MDANEDDVTNYKHSHLLQAISNLSRNQHIPKFIRNEAKLIQDEFQLVKNTTTINNSIKKNQSVHIADIVHVLKNKQHLKTRKKLKSANIGKHVLQQPLEKPATDRIKRIIGYENIKQKLSRWNAVVAKNRNSEIQVFPLHKQIVVSDSDVTKGKFGLSMKSNLMQQMEETESKIIDLKRIQLGNTNDSLEKERHEQQWLQKKITREELKAKRQEMAYLRRRESEQATKARFRNKIKSKNYHKLLKRQQLREKIKQFELLKKTNPEAALEQLNALEKSRIIERASLRHKNTGTWAKNIQIRAKYDKNARQDLAEQLQTSRHLTQKTNALQSDEDDELEGENSEKSRNDPHDDDIEKENPWIHLNNKKKQISEQEGSSNGNSNWRKYWLERNNNEQLLTEYKKQLKEIMPPKLSNVLRNQNENEQKQIMEYCKKSNKPKVLKKNQQAKVSNDVTFKVKSLAKKKKQTSKTSKDHEVVTSNIMKNKWKVENINKHTIDDIFDAGNEHIQKVLCKKMKILNKKTEKVLKQKKKNVVIKDSLQDLKDLSFQNEVQRPKIDEELQIYEDNDESQHIVEKLNEKISLVKTDDTLCKKTVVDDNPTFINTIDPNDLAIVEMNHHISNYTSVNEIIGDVNMIDENGDMDDLDNDETYTIAQAFEDDDIVADFNKQKDQDSEKTNTEINLTLPGWGKWAGAGISSEPRRRFISKLPSNEKRLDKNKCGVYINETINAELRSHLVKELPFPFTSVTDYEASIRAPIGRNNVPETAYRLLIRPSVIVRKGQIIEPMDESELIERPQRFNNPVDFRIAQLSKSKQ